MTESFLMEAARSAPEKMRTASALTTVACLLAVAAIAAAVAVAAIGPGSTAPGQHAACAVSVSAQPTGPAAPAGGWHVVFADGFGAPLGSARAHGINCARSGRRSAPVRDNLWRLPRGFVSPEQDNDLNVYNASQVRVGPNGLELVAHRQRNAGGSGRNFISGRVVTSGRFTFRSYAGATFAVECVCRWPPNGGAADPAFWHDGNEGGVEQEVDDFEAFGWQTDHATEYGAAIPTLVGLDAEHTVYHTEGVRRVFGFDPTAGFHHYTTVIRPGAATKTRAEEYIDGTYKWSIEALTPRVSVRQHLILSYALREYPRLVLPRDTTFAARAVSVYEDGAHAGRFVTGGGVAPGTVVE